MNSPIQFGWQLDIKDKAWGVMAVTMIQHGLKWTFNRLPKTNISKRRKASDYVS